ncbi:hypothetical protein OIU77_025166 [Salix suchowensis]|uniref:Allene oxide synthase n=1 Tax=Salix suchowensis TaxID=1278906 RepID=A0ABQ9BYH1_9ROSI|nr:hypothetical protein OIU77_025166 [Salix suchowensis]
MASSSSALSSLQTQLQSLKKPSSPKPSPRRFSVRPIRASISKKPSVPAPPVNVSPSEPTKLPILKIPGDYGLPLIGPFKDRMDYFYNQGRDEYFKSKIQKYRSTVFRANMPPGPFISPNPQVVVLLDGKSFPVLFDVTKVEKKDLFTGTFMPSTELTGGYRVLSYLDPSEPKHAKLKQLMFYLLKSRRDHVIPEFNAGYTELFMSLEKNLALRGKASFGEANDQAAFNFLARCWFGIDPAETTLGLDGPGLVSKWVLFNLGPVLKLGLPKYLEDLTIHTFRLPPLLIKKSYQRLYDFFYASSGFLLDEAENLGIYT